ncbi:MAG TPA: YDG domain-containing protein [Allosphingosinicella sp.]|uniref:YDG domain-containing protein n=1 Tax=Allosphingosinicella sp. TaxID=2823234 RepID=UPI002EDB374E
MTNRKFRPALLARTALGSALLLLAAAEAGAQSTVAGNIGSITGNQGNSTGVGTVGNTTSITLGNSRTVLNWNGDFNLASGSTLNFVFNGRNDIALNKVDAGSATINGVLNGTIGAAGPAGGNIWFAASNGVIFGSGAVVNTGGLLATTANITDGQFLFGPNGLDEGGAGDDNSLNFTFFDRNAGSTAGSVLVDGNAQINLNGGTLALIAPSVSTGATTVIDDTSGDQDADALFGAAEEFTITYQADAEGDLDLFSWTVPASGLSANATPISLAGTTTTGNIYLAAVTSQAASLVINPGATVMATGAAASGDGNIILTAGGHIAARAAATNANSSSVTTSISSALTAARNLAVNSTGSISVNSNLTATSGELALTASSAGSDISIGGSLAAGTDIRASAADTISSVFGVSLSGRDIDLTASDWSGTILTNAVLQETQDVFIRDTGSFIVPWDPITAARDLTITAALDLSIGGAGTPTEQVSGGRNVNLYAGRDLSLRGDVSAGAGGTVTLRAGGIGAAATGTGAITQSEGIITATTLTGRAGIGSAATLAGANALTDLGSFTATGLSVNDVGGLNINGLVDGGTGNLNISSTGSIFANGAVRSTGSGSTTVTATGLTIGGSAVQGGTGGVTINAPVSLVTGTSASVISGGNVTFGSSVNGTASLTVQAPGVTTFGLVGNTSALNHLTTDAAGSTALSGAVRITGDMIFNDAVTLGAATTLSSLGGGVITFGSSVDGAQALTVNTAGTTTFGGNVGGTNALASITTNAGGSTTIGGDVRTTGAQSYGDAATLSNGLHTINAGSLSFASTLGAATFGNPTLSTTTTGATSFGNSIFGLAGLGVTASTVSFTGTNNNIGTIAANISAGGLSFGTDTSLTVGTVNGLSGITVAPGQNIRIETPATSSMRTLTLAAPIVASGGGDVSLIYWGGTVQGSGLISGDHLLLIANEGVGASGSRVQTAVNSMSVAGGNKGVFLQEADAVTLQNTTIPACDGTCTSTISNSGASYDLTAGGAITVAAFTYGINGLSLTSTGGNILLTLPSFDRLETSADLRLTAAGSIQNVNGAPLYARDIHLSAQNYLGSILSASVLQETQDLYITDTLGGIDIGATSAARNLSITANNGGLNVTGALTAGGDISLTTTGAGNNIAIEAAVTTGTAVGRDVFINSSGGVSQTAAGIITSYNLQGDAANAFDLNTATNALTILGSINANGIEVADAGGLSIAGSLSGGAGGVNVTTSGALNVGTLVMASGNIALSGTGASGAVNVSSTVWGTGSNSTSISGTTVSLASSTVQGGTGGVSITGPVTLSGTNNLITSGGNASFSSTVNGASNLTVNASGVTSFAGAVGGTTALTSLTTDAGGTTSLGGNVRTTGAQTYGDTLSLANSANLESNANVSLGSIIGNGNALSVASSGSTAFNGAASGLSSLSANAGSVQVNGAISAGTASLTAGAGSITVNQALTATGNATLSASGLISGSGLVSGNNVSLSGGTGVGTISNRFNTNATTLAVNGGSGIAYVNEADGVTLATLGGVSNQATFDYNLTAGGTVAVNSGISSGGNVAIATTSGNISLATTASDLQATGAVNLSAAGDLDAIAGATITAQDINLSAGNFTRNILDNSALLETRDLAVTDTSGGGSFTAVSAARHLSLSTTNGGGMDVNGLAAGSNITLNSAGGINLDGSIDAIGDTVILTAAGTVTQNSGAIVAATLSGSSGGATALTSATNQIINLGAFTANGFSFAQDGSINVNGVLNGGAGGVDLDTANGSLVISASGGISSAGLIDLDSGGLLQVGGSVQGGGAGVDLQAAGAVTVSGTGQVTATGGTLRLASTGSSVSIDGLGVANGAGTVDLDSFSGVTQSAAITAGTLTGTNSGAVTLSHAGNAIGNLGAFSASGLTLADTSGLTITGTVNGGASGVNITTSGDLTVGAAIVANNGPISLTATGAGSDVALNAAVNAGAGAVALTANGTGGTISQNASGAITAGTLTGSANGAATLNAAGNAISNLGAFAANGLSIVDTGGLAVTGAVSGGTGNATLQTTGGNFTIGAAGSVTAADVVLSTNANFINQSGADAVAATGKWTIYAAAPDTSSFGGLDSGNTAIWNGTLATRGPGTLTGSRYVFAYQPTLTFTTLDLSKVYGTDASGLASTLYAVTGFHSGVAGAFLGDTAATAFTGAPVISSSGFAERASVLGGPYAVTASTGTLASGSGYALAFSNSGTITVTPLGISGTVAADNRVYDGTTGGTGSVTLTGVLAGDNVGTTGGTFTFASPNAGVQTVNVSGVSLNGADAGNYTLTLPATAVAEILRRAITGTVNVDNRVYDGTTGGTGSVTLTGVLAGDNVGTTGGTFTFASPNAGVQTVNVSGVSLNGADAGNYTLTLPATAVAEILRRAITVTADSQSRRPGEPDPALTYTITSGSLVAGENLTGALTRAAGEAPGSYAIEQGSLAASSNYQLTFVGNMLVIQPAPPTDTPRPNPPREQITDFLARLTQLTDTVGEVPLLVIEDANACVGSDEGGTCARSGDQPQPQSAPVGVPLPGERG